jgi:glycine betaine/proline transport system substrate-binding protein
MRKLYKYNVLALLTTQLVFAVPAVNAETINIGVPNWASAKVTAEVLKNIAENDLALQVGLVPSTNPVMFKAMDSGKGDIDVHPEVWMPNQQNLADQYIEKNKTVAFAGKPYTADQGYCATKNAIEKYGIQSVYDLASPSISKDFDTDGNGKGEIWIGGVGWASTNIEKIRARDYGLSEFWDLLTMDESLFLAKLDKAVKTNKPFVSYCYAPHHKWQLYDLGWVSEPAHDPAKWTMVQPTDDPNWMDNSKIDVAWAPVYLNIAYSSSLNNRAPEFVDLLQNLQLSSDIVSSWTYAISVDGKNAASYASEWIDANRNIVNQWLGL